MREKIVFCKKGIQSFKRIYVKIKKGIKFCNKLSMKVNLLVEVIREKCNLSYKSQIYKIEKTMTQTSTNIHLEVFMWFWIINRYTHKCQKGKGDYLWLLNRWTILWNVRYRSAASHTNFIFLNGNLSFLNK